ncbi:hypothetical protein [Nocardia sp. NPDC050710]|uniref:hypothetical protein n=1 Tax=Nocardia sp. NPDC050710 TaxID=3157220 RepID=UPI003407A829
MRSGISRSRAGVFAVLSLAAVGAGAPATADPTLPITPGDIVSGSAIRVDPGLATGSSGLGIPLSLEPAPSMRGFAGTGGAAVEPAAPIEAAIPDPVAASPAEALGLDTGSVATACTGSAVIGSAAILLGMATGSGSIGPALIGPGSSGSGPGSAAVGSAATGSAILTCLLLLPGPPAPAPGIPLRLGPPPEPAPAVVLAPPEPAAEPAPRAEIPFVAMPPRIREAEPIEPVADLVAWNLLELVTVLVVTVIAAFRGGRTPGSGDRSERRTDTA